MRGAHHPVNAPRMLACRWGVTAEAASIEMGPLTAVGIRASLSSRDQGAALHCPGQGGHQECPGHQNALAHRDLGGSSWISVSASEIMGSPLEYCLNILYFWVWCPILTCVASIESLGLSSSFLDLSQFTDPGRLGPREEGACTIAAIIIKNLRPSLPQGDRWPYTNVIVHWKKGNTQMVLGLLALALNRHQFLGTHSGSL